MWCLTVAIASHLYQDWPPSDEFKNVFPDLYEEFHQILPMRQYTGRDGVLNLAAHFPLNAVAPDVGKHDCDRD
jgi:[histone H3]-dimethyl-L-lysine9 demethylase